MIKILCLIGSIVIIFSSYFVGHYLGMIKGAKKQIDLILNDLDSIVEQSLKK